MGSERAKNRNFQRIRWSLMMHQNRGIARPLKIAYKCKNLHTTYKIYECRFHGVRIVRYQIIAPFWPSHALGHKLVWTAIIHFTSPKNLIKSYIFAIFVILSVWVADFVSHSVDILLSMGAGKHTHRRRLTDG